MQQRVHVAQLLTTRVLAQYLMTGDSDYKIRVAVADICVKNSFWSSSSRFRASTNPLKLCADAETAQDGIAITVCVAFNLLYYL